MASSLPKPIAFPRDNKEHVAIIEWWYFNGHVHDARGRQFSFMDCFFKADAKKINIPFLKKLPFKENEATKPYLFFAHSIITDISRQKKYKDIQNISLVSRDSFTRPLLFVNYIDPLITRGYITNEIAEVKPFTYHLKTQHLDLTLQSQKQPLLEGGNGFITVGSRSSYYYSLTDLVVKGTLYLDDETITVEGKAWMDHQWADAAYRKDQWSWFSLQLDNGTDIMAAEYNDGKATHQLVDLINADQKSEHFNRVVLTPGSETWKSKKTKAVYPLSWIIEIPDKRARLEVTSPAVDQEMVFSAINYWEGPLKISGKMDGEHVSGVGFMELVGYPSDYNYLVLMSKEFNQKLQQQFLQKIKGLRL